MCKEETTCVKVFQQYAGSKVCYNACDKNGKKERNLHE